MRSAMQSLTNREMLLTRRALIRWRDRLHDDIKDAEDWSAPHMQAVAEAWRLELFEIEKILQKLEG